MLQHGQALGRVSAQGLTFNPVSFPVLLSKPFVRGFELHAERGAQSDREQGFKDSSFAHYKLPPCCFISRKTELKQPEILVLGYRKSYRASQWYWEEATGIWWAPCPQ